MELRPGGNANLVFHNTKLADGDDPPPAKYAEYGGEVTATWRVLECEAPRRLVVSWGMSSNAPSEVTFDLAPRGDRVMFTVTHRKLASRDDMISVSGGWHTHLDILADRLEGRNPPSFWPTHTRLEDEYEQRIPRS
jgi:uncharacterized protein YndB with AHSA1/START domain